MVFLIVVRSLQFPDCDGDGLSPIRPELIDFAADVQCHVTYRLSLEHRVGDSTLADHDDKYGVN